MAYQVLARKWRPQRFDEVVGQRAVTQTLRNAIDKSRIAQAFVFAGPRGVGKTTTARILARALNCVNGPTSDPCGVCDACVEIAEGRDMDVLEIDAATHTGIDNVRAVIVEGLSIPPVRDRYKLFIIDEVHQLSTSSFNALLKSIEEPPPHAAFVMATTELGKIPETILSRAQVFEFKAISSQAIAEQLRKIADAEGIAVDDEALALVARAADGSMRDAETALDQVMAFASDTITVDDVSSVLGLVGRDLLLDVLQCVADEDGVAAFALAGRAVESGYDLKLVCRELSRMVRDLMVLAIDPSRVNDPDVAPEGERERLQALAARFSREDLLRAFDVLTRAENDIRHATEPRYHLEMALVRWIHLRKLTPLGDLIERLQADPGALRSGPSGSGRSPVAGPGSRPVPSRPPVGGGVTRTAPPAPDNRVGVVPRAGSPAERTPASEPARKAPEVVAMPGAAPSPAAPQEPARGNGQADGGGLDEVRDRFLALIQQARLPFYRTVVAQAQRIDIVGDRIVFSFAPVHRMLKEQVEQNRGWLESQAEQAAGRHLGVHSQFGAGAATEETPASKPAAPGPARGVDRDLRGAVLANDTVQALLGIFPAEIRSVEEIDPRGDRKP
ncbi:MAG: DNA polymerase III subunit gamma/tau [Bacteroidales bacterium]